METDKSGLIERLGPMPGEELNAREILEHKVYSDAMLNNLVGPLAVCRWHGDDIDIVRFNEQFYSEVKSKRFYDLVHSVQRYVKQEDLPLVYGLMERAMSDPPNGAQSVIRIMRDDGTVSQFRLRFYFINEGPEGKDFYGSARDLTHFITLDDHMRLLSRVVPATVLFLWKRGVEWSFRVAMHGLDREMGMTAEQVEQEFNDGRFERRIEPEIKRRLKQVILTSNEQMERFSAPFDALAADGRTVQLQARFCRVHDESSGVEYVLIIRKYAIGI